MMHFECLGRGWQHYLSSSWGPCRRLVEVLEDQQAARQIDIYDNGYVLKYDRHHVRDEFGMLIGLKFSRKDKWRKPFRGVRMMSRNEFEYIWAHTVSIAPPTVSAVSSTTDS